MLYTTRKTICNGEECIEMQSYFTKLHCQSIALPSLTLLPTSQQQPHEPRHMKHLQPVIPDDNLDYDIHHHYSSRRREGSAGAARPGPAGSGRGRPLSFSNALPFGNLSSRPCQGVTLLPFRPPSLLFSFLPSQLSAVSPSSPARRPTPPPGGAPPPLLARSLGRGRERVRERVR